MNKDLQESLRTEVPLGVQIEHEAGRGQERSRRRCEAELRLPSPRMAEHLGDEAALQSTA